MNEMTKKLFDFMSETETSKLKYCETMTASFIKDGADINATDENGLNIIQRILGQKFPYSENEEEEEYWKNRYFDIDECTFNDTSLSCKINACFRNGFKLNSDELRWFLTPFGGRWESIGIQHAQLMCTLLELGAKETLENKWGLLDNIALCPSLANTDEYDGDEEIEWRYKMLCAYRDAGWDLYVKNSKDKYIFEYPMSLSALSFFADNGVEIDGNVIKESFHNAVDNCLNDGGKNILASDFDEWYGHIEFSPERFNQVVDWLLKASEKTPDIFDFCGEDWSFLLGELPQFADKCDWSKFDGSNWCWLLKKQPQFADKCDKWDEFSGEDWGELLSEQPQFADKCNTSNWCWLLKKQPQFADKCDWSKFNGEDWCELLSKQPQFADKCDKWGEFDGCDWSWILRMQPQFADKCDWSKFDGDDWSILLGNLPQFADKCDWSKFDGSNWCWLLKKQPQFADKCDKWGEFNGKNWSDLLQNQPQFADKCPFKEILEK